ncbi:G3E family GTPase [Variovorax paradoxus]|uniref:G3E family GTPase n=1 Tax=Variovorax paradoxus TaxID=34073 RepID=A0AAW8ERB5_VARPD|nr:hypothetical protein [Variovorax paradoxus]MDP9974965.1 G3E family GTPase [Variovorax paradoxus]
MKVHLDRDLDLVSRAELLSELHATRLVLSRTEQMLAEARNEITLQANLRRAYDAARLSCMKMEDLLRSAVAERDELRAEAIAFRADRLAHQEAAETLCQIQASTYWRIGLRLKAFMNKYPTLRRLALQAIQRL